MSISRGVGAALGVPAALPHAGEPPGFTGEEVVNPSKTFRNFFIFILVFTLQRFSWKILKRAVETLKTA